MHLAPPQLLSEDTIIQICSDARASNAETVLSSYVGGNAVVAVSDEIVVKFGGCVTSEEFENQKVAYETLLEHESIKVPRPYRFFERDHLGYLVMDHVHGEQIQPSDSDSAQKVFELLEAFAKIPSDKPGSLGGGPLRGILWSEYHDFTPQSNDDLEQYISERLQTKPSASLNAYPLVFHHGDLAARNIKKLGDQLYVLDWASAGYLPRLFEVAAMQKNRQEPLLLGVLDLVRRRAWLSEDERLYADQVMDAANKNIRYVVGLRKLRPVKSSTRREPRMGDKDSVRSVAKKKAKRRKVKKSLHPSIEGMK